MKMHDYVRVQGWWHKRKHERYHCAACGDVTRHYDGIDLSMSRPVHSRMSVALLGFNARKR